MIYSTVLVRKVAETLIKACQSAQNLIVSEFL